MKRLEVWGIHAARLAVLWSVVLGWGLGPGAGNVWADADRQWMWMKGVKTGYQSGEYGPQGVAHATYTPGSRRLSTTWTDPSGALWLFGGYGYDFASSSGFLNDLWKFDPATGNWAWMKGGMTPGMQGVYGTPGIPDPANTPGARSSAVSWVDPLGALWLFGGYGCDGSGNEGHLNDLWKYSPATGNWTWMKGSAVRNQSGTYGALGTPAAANTPGGREGAISWTDPSGALWLFGGYGYDNAGTMDRLNDLWKYIPATGYWAWMKGSDTVNQWAACGTPGTPAAANTPGARDGAVSWADPTGALWLFGGIGKDDAGNGGGLNDLWKYDPATGNWAWMKGSAFRGQYGVYGISGLPAAANTPGARNNAVSWTDSHGALWLFGGVGFDSAGDGGNLNDLWKYDRATGNWVWMKGSSTRYQSGVYGTLGMPSPDNNPGSRRESVAWAGSGGLLWLFGGYGETESGDSDYLNDLWLIGVPDLAAPSGSIRINNDQAATNSQNATLNLTWSDGGGSGVVRMKFSNDGAIWTAWEPLAAAKPWTLLAGEGYKTVRVMFRDLAGNNSIVYSDYIRSDTLPPTGSILINNNLSVTNNRNVTLNLGWSDGAGSGVVRMKFSNDGATWTAWEPLSAAKAWTLPAGEGYKTVRVQYRDNAGNNSAIYNDFIRLDTIAPTGSIIINGGAVSTKNRNVSLGLTWADGAGSGVVRMRFSIDGRTWTAWEALRATKSYTLPATYGHHTVRATYRDAGGNISTAYNDYIRLDP